MWRMEYAIILHNHCRCNRATLCILLDLNQPPVSVIVKPIVVGIPDISAIFLDGAPGDNLGFMAARCRVPFAKATR